MNVNPAFLPKPQIKISSVIAMDKLLQQYSINTVCQDALCPNRGLCFAAQTATFLILNDNVITLDRH
jgi:lipoic acid synthetase